MERTGADLDTQPMQLKMENIVITKMPYKEKKSLAVVSVLYV